MKRVITILLVIVMCVSLCACGGNRDMSSPGGADGESAGTNIGNTPIDDSEDIDDTNTVDDASGDDTATASGDDTIANDSNGSGSQTYTEAPSNSEESTATAGSLNIDINYGSGMTVTEKTEDDMVSVDHGDGSKLYIQDVTDVYDPNTQDPAQFLYEYAYESCVDIVSATFGNISQFHGENPISVSNNELYGYGAHMTCDPQIPVYAFIKLVSVEDGYAVMIGVCKETNMNVFDNVTID